jgi:hypothetical protein
MHTSGKDQASQLLEEILVRHAAPLCRGVIRQRRYSAQESGDIESEVMLRTVARLRAAKQGTEPPLNDARKYVLTVAFSVCHALLRRYYPERARLKNRIRYVAGHDMRFAIWEPSDREWVVGLREQEGATPVTRTEGLNLPRELSGALLAMFASGPLALEDAVTTAADALGIHDAGAVAEHEWPADQRLAVDIHLSQRGELEWLWRELLQLPERQRAALLLNLRDDSGQGAIELLPATGVASIRQIAAAVGMAVDRFAALWRDLPIEDTRVAELLGVSRQQVINLRKAGRFRLLRRRQRGNMGPVSVSSIGREVPR